MNATGTSRTVRAHWHVSGHRDLPKITNVALIDGYSTEADIPKIIAIRFFDLDWADRIIVTATAPVPDGVLRVADRSAELHRLRAEERAARK